VTALVEMILQLACALDEHGPFSLPLQSIAASSPLPPIRCLTCGADCRHLLIIEKPDIPARAPGVTLWNTRSAPAIVIGVDSSFVVDARAAAFVNASGPIQ
jgi:hypothetical protein